MMDLVQKYLPDLLECIPQKGSLVKRLEAFKVRYENLKIKLAKEGDSKMDVHSIFEWIVSAEAGDRKSAAFLAFLNHTCKNVQLRIDNRLHSKLKSIITNILVSFDTDVDLKNNPAYLNYLGELLIIDRILSASDKFRLEGIEVKLPNGKTADIQITDIVNGTKVLFDIVSINSFDTSVPKCDDDVRAFFEGKYNQKLETKTYGIKETDNGTVILITGDEFQFAIAPIIWNELNDLVKWSEILTKIESNYFNVLPLCILYAAKSEVEDYVFNFTKISEALRHIDTQHSEDSSH